VARLREKLGHLARLGLERRLVETGDCRGAVITVEGSACLNLSSNDYLGLASDRELLREFYRLVDCDHAMERYGLGAASSRLLTGNRQIYTTLEERLAGLYGRKALVFNSGYHANIGILPALSSRGDLVLADKLCHASLIDGMRLSRATVKRFRHADYEHLEKLLAAGRQGYANVFIVSESIFSMDGDRADLARLLALKREYDCYLYLDEAHAVGVYGDRGLGCAEESGVIDEVDILVGTLGKALASLGAFVITSETIREVLVNTMRSLIFTTALPPVNLAWSLFALDRVTAMTAERKRLSAAAQRLRRELAAAGLRCGGESQIIPVIIGDAGKTTRIAARLRDQGILLLPIRPPTVPDGTARFRLSLSAAMHWDDLGQVPHLLSDAVAGV